MAKKITWKIQKKSIDDLKPHEKNPRIFTEKGMKDLENSIKSVGFFQPIVANLDGTILSGHARLLKLKELGETEIDVMLPDRNLTEKQEEEILVRANANTAGKWDFDILANQFEDFELTEWGLEIPEMEMEIEELKAEEDDFDNEPPSQPKTVLGDLYEIGEHRLLCGDSTDSDQVSKLMNGDKADMVFTDPPYGVDYKGINNDNRSGLKKLLESAFSNYVLNSKNGASIYCFHSDKCSDIFNEVFRKYCHFSSMIIWVKESIVLSQTDYQSKHEPCFYGWFDNGTHRWYSDRKQESVWVAKSKRYDGHTTPKPIEIISKGIENSSLINHLVLDLFLGSGSTMAASHQLKRKCYGMELDPKYCDVIVKRMLRLDPKLLIKRNGVDCKEDFLND